MDQMANTRGLEMVCEPNFEFGLQTTTIRDKSNIASVWSFYIGLDKINVNSPDSHKMISTG